MNGYEEVIQLNEERKSQRRREVREVGINKLKLGNCERLFGLGYTVERYIIL